MSLSATVSSKNLGHVWDNFVPDHYLCFCPIFFMILFLISWEIHLSKTCYESTVWLANLCNAAGYILLPPRLPNIYLYKNSVFISLVGPFEMGKLQFIYIGPKLDRFIQNLTKFILFHQPSQPLYGGRQKQIDNLEFVEGINVELLDLLKNKGTKSEEIGNI